MKVYFDIEVPSPTASAKEMCMSNCPKVMVGYLPSPPIISLHAFLATWTAQLFI